MDISLLCYNSENKGFILLRWFKKLFMHMHTHMPSYSVTRLPLACPFVLLFYCPVSPLRLVTPAASAKAEPIVPYRVTQTELN